MRGMANVQFERQIRKTIEAFVEELSELVRQAAVQSVTDAFGAGAVRGRALVSVGRRGAAVALRPKGQKRAPEDLASIADQLLAAVKAAPGQRMEQIAKTLHTTTKDLALPARKLISERKIKTKGERRATKYFAA